MFSALSRRGPVPVSPMTINLNSRSQFSPIFASTAHRSRCPSLAALEDPKPTTLTRFSNRGSNRAISKGAHSISRVWQQEMPQATTSFEPLPIRPEFFVGRGGWIRSWIHREMRLRSLSQRPIRSSPLYRAACLRAAQPSRLHLVGRGMRREVRSQRLQREGLRKGTWL